MEWIVQILAHTPWWVFAIFALLIYRAVRATRPNVTSLWRMAVIPGILTLWSLAGLAERTAPDTRALLAWIVSLAVGAAIGWLMLRGVAVRADHARGLVWRPGDWSYPPLVLAIFVVKYAFGYMSAVEPSRLLDPGFRLAEIMTSGVITGVFVGKFTLCMLKYRAAPSETLEAGS